MQAQQEIQTKVVNLVFKTTLMVSLFFRLRNNLYLCFYKKVLFWLRQNPFPKVQPMLQMSQHGQLGTITPISHSNEMEPMVISPIQWSQLG